MYKFFFLLLMLSFRLQAQTTPSTEQVIDKMIAAHGGMAQWKATQTVYFDHIMMFGEGAGREWWIAREMTDMKTMRTYQDWPFSKSTLVFDGNKTWTTGWPNQNPPAMMVNNHLTAYSLPWLTKDKNVKTDKLGTSRLPGDTLDYHTLRLSFLPASGHSPEKYYIIFIHPETFLMAGWEYNVTYGAFLDLIQMPPQIKAMGPLRSVIHSYTKAGSIIFPSKYDTFGPDGSLSGTHVLIDFERNKIFDKSRMKMPDNAVVDMSSPLRKK
ncbi:MAG: hypothetical protein ACKVUS_05065 [Saprospiraceae bacterium]